MTLSLRLAALLIVIASAAILGGAFAFQHIGGLAPCVLCIWQRYTHGAAIALAAAAVIAAPGAPLQGGGGGGYRNVAAALLAGSGIALLAGAAIAGFHVGVEMRWWEGTAECGSTIGPSDSIDALRARLLAQPIVRCDEIAWSLFGISMAGYNFLLSLGLAAFAVRQAIPRRAR